MAIFKSKQQRLDHALMKALRASKPDQVRSLLQQGADPNFRDEYGWTPVIRAVYRQEENMLILLLECGAVIDWSVISAAIRYIPMLKIFVAHGVDLNMTHESSGNNLLHEAVESGRWKTVQYLLEQGVRLDVRNKKHLTPIDLLGADDKSTGAVIRQFIDQRRSEKINENSGWIKTSDDEITKISEKPAIQRSVTEIFNFTQRKYTQIIQNLETKAESQAVVFFADFGAKDFLQQARDELLRQGGHADPVDAGKPMYIKKSDAGIG